MSGRQWEVQDGFEFKRISKKPLTQLNKPTSNKPAIKSAIRSATKTDENSFKKRRHTVSWLPSTKPAATITTAVVKNSALVKSVEKEFGDQQFRVPQYTKPEKEEGQQPEKNIIPETKNKPNNHSSHRRSSLTRGKRLSGSVNGLLLLPHAAISSSDYYRHIDASLTDPLRMHQLLVWCTQKAMTIIRKGDKETDKSVKDIVKKVQTSVIDGLIQKQINVSWDKQENAPNTTITTKVDKQPNPQNIYNLEKIAQLQKCLDKIAQEELQWKSTLHSMTSKHAQIIDECASLDSIAKSENAHEQARSYVALDVEKVEFLEKRKEGGDELGEWLKQVFLGIQKEVYRLNSNIAKSAAYDDAVTKKFGDKITGDIFRAYSNREKNIMDVEGIELLGLLSSE